MGYSSFESLLQDCYENHKPIWQSMMDAQIAETDESKDELLKKMQHMLLIMKQAAQNGLHEQNQSRSGLSGGQANKLYKYCTTDNANKNMYLKAAAIAIGMGEVNAAMGRIVAAPTAGSCGILPGVLLSAQEEYGFIDEQLVQALFTASAVGQIISARASISGAQGGCQAECGSAASMAAAALCQLLGGEPTDSINAAALSMKSLMGLVCDPVAGLVEIPCIKRNANCTSIAITSCHMALAGIQSMIPADEVMDAMSKIGTDMPSALKETSNGGLATTPTAVEIAKRLYHENTSD